MFLKYQKENKFSRRFGVNTDVRDQYCVFADAVLQKSTYLMHNIEHCWQHTPVYFSVNINNPCSINSNLFVLLLCSTEDSMCLLSFPLFGSSQAPERRNYWWAVKRLKTKISFLFWNIFNKANINMRVHAVQLTFHCISTCISFFSLPDLWGIFSVLYKKNCTI